MIRHVLSLVLAVAVFAATACGAAPTAAPTAPPTPDASATAAAVAAAAQAQQTEVARQVAQTLTAAAPTVTNTPVATATNTAIPRPTDTPSPTATTVPTSKPPPGTFGNPVLIGAGYTFAALGTLKVERTTWRSKQTGIAVVYLAFACERPQGQECDTGDFMLDAVGASGNGYSQAFDVAVPAPLFGSFDSPPLYGGGSQKGYAGFRITGQEASLLMRVKIFLESGEVFFRISN